MNRLDMGLKSVSGVYVIRFAETGVYIGSTKDLRGRIDAHINSFKRGYFYNSEIESFVLEFGTSNISFEVIEICSRENLNSKEKYFINNYPSKVFNLSLKDGYVLSENHKLKISKGNKGKLKPMSDEHRKKISKSNTGKKRPESEKEKISNGLKNAYANGIRKPLTEEKRKLYSNIFREIGKAQKGRVVSEEHKKKISETMKKNFASGITKKPVITSEMMAKVRQAKKNKK